MISMTWQLKGKLGLWSFIGMAMLVMTSGVASASQQETLQKPTLFTPWQ